MYNKHIIQEVFRMKTEKEINMLIVEAKKEVDRLEEQRHKDLGNSMNFIHNEIELQRTLAQIEAYEETLN